MAPLIALQDVHRTYVTGGGVEVHALKGVSLEIFPGEFVAIVGQSGSGKSTLMNVIGCLDRPSRGLYRFRGRDVATFDADQRARLRRETFGFVFQGYHLLGAASALENVEVPAIYAGLPAAARQARATELLTSLGLGERLDHRPNQLSGGQQQRVSIARALMNGGEVILADEPTGALDSASGAEVMALLKSLAQAGHTIILITHDHDVAAQADRQVELLDGRIVHDSRAEPGDRPDSVIERPAPGGSRRMRSLGEAGEAIRMAWRSLARNRLRTALTLLGVVIGVGSVVTMLAVGEGARQQVVDRIAAMGVNVLSVQPGFGPQGRSQLSLRDAEAVQRVPGVATVIPRIQGQMTLRYGNVDLAAPVTGISANYPEQRNRPVGEGVFFSELDNDEFAPVAVLGTTTARQLFMDGSSAVGRYILVGDVPFLVIGVLTSQGSDAASGTDRDAEVFVPLMTAALRLYGRTSLDSMLVLGADAGRMAATEEAVRRALVEARGRDDFLLMNSGQLMQMVSDSQRTFTILLGSIAAISLLVGGIGIMNIMLVSVTERTREIGVRMATGARQSDILSQFLVEAVVVSVLGGLLGLLAGVAAGQVAEALGQPVRYTGGPMLLAFSSAALIGLIFGLAPAHKASRLDPVQALASD